MKRNLLLLPAIALLAACNPVLPPDPADTTGPSVNITTAANTTGSTVILSADASDPSGVKNVQFWLDDTLVNTDTTAPYSFTTSTSFGTHNLKVLAVDNAGNTSTVERSITVTAPEPEPNHNGTATISGPDVITGEGYYTFTTTAADPEGVANARLTLHDAAGNPIYVQDVPAGNTDYSLPFNNTLNGTVTAVLRVTDSLDNVTSTQKIITVKIP